MNFVYRPWVWSIPFEGHEEESGVVFEMCSAVLTSHFVDTTIFKLKWR